MEKVKEVKRNKKVGFFKDKVNKYKELPEKTRSIINLWVVIILIIIIIIVVCNVNNKHLKTYEDVENNIETAAIKYAKEKNLEGVDSQKVKIDMEVLIKDKYLTVDKNIRKRCVGYALVYTNNDEEVKSKGYLSCNGYATDGFSFE